MAHHYLLQVAYTPEAWASLLKNPQDRTQVLKPVLEKLGGSFNTAYFAFGEYDIVAIMEMPANIDAAAFAMAAAAGGAIKAIKTTPLMTVEEGISAMKKAARAGYVPPGAVAGV
jgi:uncharacterized protein with GYD domain